MARAKDKKPSGMTQISISLPEDLVAMIDKMAMADNRNRSNFIANEIRKMAQRAEYFRKIKGGVK